MVREEYKLLDRVSSPRDLKKLSLEELRLYCDELRRYIIEACSVNPGHLASSLGTVELSAALHYVFETPDDKLVWDVGHQTYAHKIITGRRGAFATKRRLGGISGFPRMSESEYDAFGGGHASVSISAAFGMAKAAELRGERRKVVAVIGDGSMTGGLAFEGLNNAGASKTTDLLVILNDNHMAIDQATGALKNYLLRISTSEHYNRFKQRLWRLMSHTPWLLRLCQKADLYHRFCREMEVSHHIKMFSVHRIMEREIVANPANLKPCGITFQVTTVGVIGIPLCHHAHRGVRAKIR